MMILPGSGLKAGDGKPDFGGVMGVPVASPTVGGEVVGFISIKAPANAGPAKPTSAAEAIRSFRSLTPVPAVLFQPPLRPDATSVGPPPGGLIQSQRMSLLPPHLPPQARRRF